MPRAKKLAAKKPKIQVTTVVFTQAEKAVLQRVSRDASDVIGRRISGSQVLRAVVQWLGVHGLEFSREEIVPIIENELSLLHWGRKKGS